MADTPSPGVVSITGGSSGIGLATAELFAAKGWRVALIARGTEALDAARARLLSRGATVATAVADVTDSDALRRAAAAIESELGPIDVWINNAGVSVFSTFAAMSEAEFERVTDVVYGGTVNGTRVALERMRPRNAGAIVNVCSAIGLRGVPLQSAYSGAKWAMRGFTEAMRAELMHERSRIWLSMIYPPSVNTPFYSHATAHLDGRLPRPPPPIYQPEVVAKAIHFAVTNRRREMLVGGQTVQTALLNAVAPALADRLLGSVGPFLQKTDNPGIAAARDENLFSASRRASTTHGAFDRESLPVSAQLWATRNRKTAAAGLTFGIALLGLMARGGRR